MMTILGIETSCDETSAAVVDDGRHIRSNIVRTQKAHEAFMGVVPEIASRCHVESVRPAVQAALSEAGCTLSDIDGVAVANQPGLVGALLVGVHFAKGLAAAAGLPLYGINHIYAHIYAAFLAYGDIALPALAVVLSGGHTVIFRMESVHDYTLLATTRDDAIGECVDKVAKYMGLGYPGGPVVERLAREGRPDAVDFPVARIKGSDIDFSYSGLKTAVIQTVDAGGDIPRADLLASFQRAVFTPVLNSLERLLLRQAGIRSLIFSGGVTANGYLRERARERFTLPVYFPPLKLCTDNAAMIAGLADHSFRRGEPGDYHIGASPRAEWVREKTAG